MKTKLFLWLLCTAFIWSVTAVMAQNHINWQAADASGAGTSMQGTTVVYSSVGQAPVAVSSTLMQRLYSGFLYVRIVPQGAANIVAQSTLDFGNVIVAQTSMLPITVQNTGALPLDITGMTISPSEYTILSGGGPQTVGPGGSITLQIQFRPVSTGVDNGTLVINSNAANAPAFSVALSGTGVATAPRIQLSATSLDFGVVNTSTSSVRSVTINNTGNASLTISNQTVTGSDASNFSITHPTGTSILSNGSDYVELRFSPATAGVKTAVLTITSNDPNTPSVTVLLGGTGTTVSVPHISLSQAQLEFGTTAPSTPVERSVVISNTGSADLILSSQTVGGAGFTLQTPASSPIAPGGNASVRIMFNPASNGPYTGNFSILCNDPSAASVSVPLRGTCSSVSGPRIALSRTLIDFGSVPVLTSKEEDVVVRNIGSSDLVIQQQLIAGTDALHFSIVQPATTPIIASGNCTMRIRHLPISGGSKSAILRLQTNDAGMPVAEVALVSIVTDVEKLPDIPTGIVLRQNYPNPFNPSTMIEYGIDQPGVVELEVYSMLGVRISVLDNQPREAGTYRTVFDASLWPSGVYTAVLLVRTSKGTVQTRSIWMTLTK